MNIFKENIDWPTAAYDDKETQNLINKIMSHNLRVLCREIIETIPNVVSIYLTGGYSASEGNIMVNGREIKILSDYDFVVIINGQSPITSLQENSFRKLRNMYKMPGHPTCELIIWNLKELHNLSPSKFLFDFQLAKCIYGEEVGRMVPRFPVTEIPLDDGLRLIFNRIFGALIPFSPTFLNTDLSVKKRRHLAFESAKLVLGSCEAFLMLEGALSLTQRENVRRFKEIILKKSPLIFKRIPTIDRLIERALEYRLNPNSEVEKEALDIWFGARELALLTLERFLERFYGKKHFHLEEVTNHFIQKNPHPFILNILATTNMWKKYNRLRLNLLFKKPYNALLAMRLYLLLSVKRNGKFDKELLNKARRVLAEHMGIDVNLRNPCELWALLKQYTLQNYVDPFVPVQFSLVKQTKLFLLGDK